VIRILILIHLFWTKTLIITLLFTCVLFLHQANPCGFIPVRPSPSSVPVLSLSYKREKFMSHIHPVFWIYDILDGSGCWPVHEGPDPSTGHRSGDSAVFVKSQNIKICRIPQRYRMLTRILNAGSVVQCRTDFSHFYGTRAKADVLILTLGPRSASHLFNCVPYRTVPYHLKNPQKS
jgi:hypothetical protein